MRSSCTRRRFLQTSTGLLAGIGASGFLGHVAAAEAKPRLCVGCRDEMLKYTGIKDCWSAMEAIGADGVEAWIDDDLSLPQMQRAGRKYSVATPAAIEQLKADALGARRRITAIRLGNRFDERPKLEIEWCARVARAAQSLGVRAIRIDVVSHTRSAEKFLDSAVAILKKVVDATESTGVCFGVENHGPANSPEFLTSLFERVGSTRLGLTLDTANFYWFGFPLSKVYKLYETFAPRGSHPLQEHPLPFRPTRPATAAGLGVWSVLLSGV